MHGTLWNAIFTNLIRYEIDIIDTLRFNNDADFLYQLATALKIRPNHEYWCKYTSQTSGINKTGTSDRLDLGWQLGFQWHRRGIELVLQVPRLFHNATVSQCDHFVLLHIYMYLLFEASPGWLPGWRGFFLPQFWWGALSSNVLTICAVYWSLGRRGYFGVSNVVLVLFCFVYG